MKTISTSQKYLNDLLRWTAATFERVPTPTPPSTFQTIPTTTEFRSLLSHTHLSFIWGTWIAEWYDTRLSTLVCWAMPWTVSLCLGVDQRFTGPKNSIYTVSWFFLVYFILYYNLSVKFVKWIVKQKTEKNLFKKISTFIVSISIFLIATFKIFRHPLAGSGSNPGSFW